MSAPPPKIFPARRIAPAPQRDGKDGQEEQSRKRAMVLAACLQCQKKKCKCDGSRPTCQPCRSRQLECEFEVPAGISQKDRIKQKYDALDKKAADLDRLVYELIYSAEEHAINLLVRLRSGEPIENILQSRSSPTPTGAMSGPWGSPLIQSNQDSFGTGNALTAAYCQSELPMPLEMSGALFTAPLRRSEDVTEVIIYIQNSGTTTRAPYDNKSRREIKDKIGPSAVLSAGQC